MHPPAAELLLLNLLAPGHVLRHPAGAGAAPRQQGVGRCGGPSAAAVLVCLAALLRLIFSNKPRLGLMYVPVRQPSSSASSWRTACSASVVSGISLASQGNSRAAMPSFSKTLGPGPSNADEATTRTWSLWSSGLSSTASSTQLPLLASGPLSDSSNADVGLVSSSAAPRPAVAQLVEQGR